MSPQDKQEIKRLEARKAALAIRMKKATGEKRQEALGEIIEIDLKISTIRHVLPEYR